MKKLLLIILLICCAASAFAAKANLPVDGLGIRINDFAPSGRKSAELTVSSVTVDATDDLRYSIYSPTACAFRLMSTATVAGIKHTLPANAITSRAVNPATPFLNFSGCASGELQVQ